MNNPAIRTILCVHQGYELYGSDRSFLLSIKAVKKYYPDAHITALIPQDGPLVEYLEDVVDTLLIRDIAIVRKNEIKNDLLRFLKKLIPSFKKACHDFRTYDVVYINTIVVLDYILASFFFKRRSILHIREIPIGIPRLIFSLLIRMSNAYLIFNSQHTQDTYKFVHNGRGKVVLNGVQGFLSISPINFSNRKSVRILHLGRFSSWKGQALLLDAIAELPESEKQKIEVHIVGSVFADQHFYKDQLLKQLKDCDLASFVSILPFTKVPEGAYQWADIVVVSSTKPEPFGRVAIEAMSAGRCVIAADHGGLLEIISHIENGLFFTANNVSSLSSAITQLINNKLLLMKLGEAGRETFAKKFTEECYMENFKNSLRSFFC